MRIKVIVDVNHPAQVHFIRYLVQEMGRKGHEILITASEKEVSLKLLNSFGYKYVNLGSYGDTLVKKLINIPLMDLRMLRVIRKFDPDIVLGLGSIRAAHASRALRKKCINLEDTECSREQIMLYLPFVDAVCTPSSFRQDLGKKQIRFDANKELAYLHPAYFKPDPGVLAEQGLAVNERYIVVRFITWAASHDIGHHGIIGRKEFIKELEKYGRVLISSEGKLDEELEKYRIRLPPEKFHDLLYYAALYIGEGGTTASESALLGTHAILIDTMADQCGVFHDLNSYGLLWFTKNTRESLETAERLLKDPGLEDKGKAKLEQVLSHKINITRFMVWFVENFPESFRSMKQTPELQYGFK